MHGLSAGILPLQFSQWIFSAMSWSRKTTFPYNHPHKAMSEALALKYIGRCYLFLLYLRVRPWPAQDIAWQDSHSCLQPAEKSENRFSLEQTSNTAHFFFPDPFSIYVSIHIHLCTLHLSDDSMLSVRRRVIIMPDIISFPLWFYSAHNTYILFMQPATS